MITYDFYAHSDIAEIRVQIGQSCTPLATANKINLNTEMETLVLLLNEQINEQISEQIKAREESKSYFMLLLLLLIYLLTYLITF